MLSIVVWTLPSVEKATVLTPSASSLPKLVCTLDMPCQPSASLDLVPAPSRFAIVKRTGSSRRTMIYLRRFEIDIGSSLVLLLDTGRSTRTWICWGRTLVEMLKTAQALGQAGLVDVLFEFAPSLVVPRSRLGLGFG